MLEVLQLLNCNQKWQNGLFSSTGAMANVILGELCSCSMLLSLFKAAKLEGKQYVAFQTHLNAAGFSVSAFGFLSHYVFTLGNVGNHSWNDKERKQCL